MLYSVKCYHIQRAHKASLSDATRHARVFARCVSSLLENCEFPFKFVIIIHCKTYERTYTHTRIHTRAHTVCTRVCLHMETILPISAKAGHVDEFFYLAVCRVFFFILIYPVIVRAYIACYVESHIRRCLHALYLCVKSSCRSRSRDRIYMRAAYIRVYTCVQSEFLQVESNSIDRE